MCTYSVRRTTLRAIFMDLATELGEQGFHWIFIVHGHGAPYHNLMLDQAGDYFRDTFGGTMVHLRGLAPTAEQLGTLKLDPLKLELSDSDREEIGAMDEHAGFDETSRMLFLRPDLVSAEVRRLEPLPVNVPSELFARAQANGWPGYLGSPRLASARHGALLQRSRSKRDVAIALAILEGILDERDIPRQAKIMIGNEQIMSALAASSRNEQERARRQREWLTKRGIESEPDAER